VALDVTERIDTEQVLAPLLARARRLAAERGAPVLVSWSERVAAEDPIDVFAQAATASDRCLWLQPDADFALVGVGAAHVIEPTGPERFAAADAAWRALLDGALIVGDGPGPTVIGGFAFDPERPSTPRWCGFPDARLILPRQTLTLQGGECWRRVNVVVGDRHPSPPTPLPTLGEGSGGQEGKDAHACGCGRAEWSWLGEWQEGLGTWSVPGTNATGLTTKARSSGLGVMSRPGDGRIQRRGLGPGGYPRAEYWVSPLKGL